MVACVWAIIALSTLITANYTALGAVTPVMMIVVGFLFGFRNESKKISQEQQPPPATLPPVNRDLSDW